MEAVDMVIVGAGMSGLVTAKIALDAGLGVVVLEKSDHVGGVWHYEDKGYGVMNFTHIRCSRLPSSHRPGQVHQLVHECRRHIRFHSKVTSLRRADDLWKVTAESTDSRQTTVLTARFVAVATGHHVIPHMAHFDGLETFPGRIIHSSNYKSAAFNGVQGERLLIVGIGNSAIDAATEAALSGRCEVSVSTRSGAWVFSNYVFGYPVDLHVCRMFLWMPWKISTIMTTGHPNKWGLNPKKHQLAGHPAVGPALIHCIQRGFVKVKPDIVRIDGNEILFTDGTTSVVDDIVMCTGYNIDFLFLDDELRTMILPGNNALDLYKYVFSPDVGPSLAFIGFVQTTSGGILPVSETQARWFIQLCKGNVRLPSKNSMKTSLYQDRERNRRRFYASPRHTIQVDPIVYNDEVASFFGARPSFWRHPLLTWRLLLGSGGASQWRLDGPDRWPNASQQIVKVPVPELMISIGSLLFVLLFVLLCSLVALFW